MSLKRCYEIDIQIQRIRKRTTIDKQVESRQVFDYVTLNYDRAYSGIRTYASRLHTSSNESHLYANELCIEKPYLRSPLRYRKRWSHIYLLRLHFYVYVRLRAGSSWLWNEIYCRVFVSPPLYWCFRRVIRFSDWCTFRFKMHLTAHRRYPDWNDSPVLIFWIYEEIYLWDWIECRSGQFCVS